MDERIQEKLAERQHRIELLVRSLEPDLTTLKMCKFLAVYLNDLGDALDQLAAQVDQLESRVDTACSTVPSVMNELPCC